jgi:DNA-binding LacI/PurR family transcriptional regulator
LKHAFVLRDAMRMGVRCLTSGTPLMSLRLPGVAEDNGQLIRVAMDHLEERGHREVGLALPKETEPWVFERLEAYERRMSERGRMPRVFWTTTRRGDESEVEGLERWLREGGMTAVIPGGAMPMQLLDRLVREGRLKVPEEMSVVSFEPDHGSRGYLGHSEPTRVEFPFREMGGKLAEMARRVVDGEAVEGVERLAGRLVEGSTVR